MIDRPDLTSYLTKSPLELRSILATVCTELCGLIQEVALAESAELESRIDGWLSSSDTTVKGREWAASTAAAGYKQTVIDRKADLAVRTEEKWFLLRLLDGDSK